MADPPPLDPDLIIPDPPKRDLVTVLAEAHDHRAAVILSTPKRKPRKKGSSADVIPGTD